MNTKVDAKVLSELFALSMLFSMYLMLTLSYLIKTSGDMFNLGFNLRSEILLACITTFIITRIIMKFTIKKVYEK